MVADALTHCLINAIQTANSAQHIHAGPGRVHAPGDAAFRLRIRMALAMAIAASMVSEYLF